jgi:hypothetical protein
MKKTLMQQANHLLNDEINEGWYEYYLITTEDVKGKFHYQLIEYLKEYDKKSNKEGYNVWLNHYQISETMFNHFMNTIKVKEITNSTTYRKYIFSGDNDKEYLVRGTQVEKALHKLTDRAGKINSLLASHEASTALTAA